MQLSIHVTKDQSARLAGMKDAGARLLGPLARAWAGGAQEILGRAVKGRFMGKGPFPVAQNKLGVVTNRLRKSMRATAVQVNAADGTASVSMGSNVSYYRGHEFGFRGQVQVRGHTRKAVAGGTTTRGKLTRKGINDRKVSKLVRGRSNDALVRPHWRKVNIPARRPLGTEIAAIGSRVLMYSKIKAVMARMLGGAK